MATRQHRGGQRKLGRGGKPFEDEFGDRAGKAVAEAEIAVQRGPEEFGVLHEKGLIEAQRMHQLDALLLGEVLAEHGGDGVADIGEHGEGNEGDGQQHRDGLQQP